MRLLKEPLFHFFLMAVAVFAWFSLLNPPSDTSEAPDRIVVDTSDVDRLLNQYEATWRRPPTAKELDTMIGGLVREEVMVREARALGLDTGDGVIRGRLVQKMDFLTTSVAQAMEPDDETLQGFLNANAERFTVPGQTAFAQVYLGQEAGADTVTTTLAALSGGADPQTQGARSLLPGGMPLAPARTINGTFGRGFAEALAALPVGTWAGPVQSGYGAHLVRVTERTSAALPPFDTIREDVLLEWRRDTTEELAKAQYEALEAGYDIEVPDVATLAERLNP